MSGPVRLRLPIPPSVNASYANVPGRGRVATKALRQWKKDAGWMLQSQRPGRVAGKYRACLYLPERMRGDVDGRLKAALDLLVTHGVTDDDHFAHSALAERSEIVGVGECLIVIEPYREASNG